MDADAQPILRCYRLTSRCDHDEEAIWLYVQRSGGHIAIRQDCIDFWVDSKAAVFLLCAWPELDAQPQLDLY